MTTMCDNGDGKPAVRSGLCWACVKQIQRTGSTIRRKPQHGVRYPTREARRFEAALHVAEAEDLKRALDRLRKAQAPKRRKSDTVHKAPNYPRGD